MLTCTEGIYLILTCSLLGCTVGESSGNTEGKIKNFHHDFPEVYAVLKVWCILPMMKVENECCEEVGERV